jgi:hypothetical protein
MNFVGGVLQQCEWLLPILQDALRHMYQRCLLETQLEILELVEQVREFLFCIFLYPHPLLIDITSLAF